MSAPPQTPTRTPRMYDPTKGPKHLLPVMPRTGFAASYNQFIEKKLEAQLKER
jgi:hypothetical protein